MSKIVLTNVANFINETVATGTMAVNNNVITSAFDNTLSRDGTGPNQMLASFDMNSYRILNLPAPLSAAEPLRFGDLTSITGVLSLPSLTVIGNIPFFTTVNGKALGVNPTFQISNPGSAALYSQVPAPINNNIVKNGLQVSIGPAIDGAHQNGSGLLGLTQGIVGTADIAAGDALSFGGVGVAGYARTNQPTGGLGAAAVGVFGQGAVGCANASVFGGNFRAMNTEGNPSVIGVNCNYIAGCEIDVDLWKLSGGADPTVTNGHCYGVVVAGSSNLAASISKSSGYVLDRLSVQTSIPWNYGYSTYDGAATVGLFLGSSGSGNNVSSQPVYFKGRNSGGLDRIAGMQGDANGTFVIAPDSNSGITAFLNGLGGSIIFAVGSSFGNVHINVPGLATAGVLTNDTSGNILSTPVLSTALGGVDQTGWTVYSPGAVTATTGTPSAVTATGRYQKVGKTIIVQVVVTVGAAGVGTAAGDVIVPLPFTAANSAGSTYVGSSYESGVSGNAGVAVVLGNFSGTVMRIKNGSAATYWVNNYIVAGQVAYEIP